MARAALILAFVVSAFGFLFTRLSMDLGVEFSPLLHLYFFLPAVLLGVESWVRRPGIARAWPVLACVALAWIGLLYAPHTESHRGALIAALLTIVPFVAALIMEHGCWRLCARTYVMANTATFGLALWWEYLAQRGSLMLTLYRFGYARSLDRSTVTTNPNEMGGQWAVAAVLAFVLYLECGRRAGSALASGGRRGQFSPLWAVALSLGTILTGSRGALVAWLAGMAPLLLVGTRLQPFRRLRDLVALGVAGVLLAAMVCTVLDVALWARTAHRWSGHQADTVLTVGSRLEIWETGLSKWLSDLPLTVVGTGTGMADELLGMDGPFYKIDQHGTAVLNAHSVYVEWILSFGLVGIVPGLWLLALVWHRARRLDRGQGVVHRRAILAAVLLFAATAVVYRQPAWLAVGSLALAMLAPPLPAHAALPAEPRPPARGPADRPAGAARGRATGWPAGSPAAARFPSQCEEVRP